VKGCHNVTLCGVTSKLPDNITVTDDTSAVMPTTMLSPTSPSFVNSTRGVESVADQEDEEFDGTGNVALMLREENPSVAFDAQFHVFYIVDDSDIYLSRFDVDPMKDTGGTLRVSIKFRQYHRVSITLCSYQNCSLHSFIYKSACLV